MTTEPLTTAEAKTHLHLTDSDWGVSGISAAVTAARQAVEQYLNATVANRERRLILDGFPVDRLSLPNGPVISIVSVTYVDTDGNEQALDSSDYRLTNYELQDVLTPAYGQSWPATRDVTGAVTIVYNAGMMTGSPLTLPDEDIKAALKLILGDIWANSEQVMIGVSVDVNPTCQNLLHFHRRELGI